MTEVGVEPGPLWPDDVVEAAITFAANYEPATFAAMIHAALNAPEVTAHLLARHKDGYDSGVEASRAEWREVLTEQVKPEVSQLLAENTRLATALAAAERQSDALAAAHRRRLCSKWKPGHTYSGCCDHRGCHNAWRALVEAGVKTEIGHRPIPAAASREENTDGD